MPERRVDEKPCFPVKVMDHHMELVCLGCGSKNCIGVRAKNLYVACLDCKHIEVMPNVEGK